MIKNCNPKKYNEYNLLFFLLATIFLQTLPEFLNSSITNHFEANSRLKELSQQKSWIKKCITSYEISYIQEYFFISCTEYLIKFLKEKFKISISQNENKIEFVLFLYKNQNQSDLVLDEAKMNFLKEENSEDILELIDKLLQNFKSALIVFYELSQRIKYNYSDFMYLTDDEILSIDFFMILLHYNNEANLFLHFENYNKLDFEDNFKICLTFNLNNHLDTSVAQSDIEMVKKFFEETYSKNPRTLSNIKKYENYQEFEAWIIESEYESYLSNGKNLNLIITSIFRYTSIYSRQNLCFKQNSLKFLYLNFFELIDIKSKFSAIDQLSEFGVKKNLSELERLILEKGKIFICNNFFDNFYIDINKKANQDFEIEHEACQVKNFDILRFFIDVSYINLEILSKSEKIFKIIKVLFLQTNKDIKHSKLVNFLSDTYDINVLIRNFLFLRETSEKNFERDALEKNSEGVTLEKNPKSDAKNQNDNDRDKKLFLNIINDYRNELNKLKENLYLKVDDLIYKIKCLIKSIKTKSFKDQILNHLKNLKLNTYVVKNLQQKENWLYYQEKIIMLLEQTPYDTESIDQIEIKKINGENFESTKHTLIYIKFRFLVDNYQYLQLFICKLNQKFEEFFKQVDNKRIKNPDVLRVKKNR